MAELQMQAQAPARNLPPLLLPLLRPLLLRLRVMSITCCRSWQRCE
jgi:hypothetical protein